ncbi:phosphoribosylformylglycinamidine synthase subunit PurQ [Nannocystaceae bacterium ST9]
MISEARAIDRSRVEAATAAQGLDARQTAEVRVLIPTGYGLNCEAETAAAFGLLGARVELCHVADLLAAPARLHEFDVLAFIGGFSFGDHVASGRVFANRMRFRLGDDLARFVDDRGLVIGMCNGFQVLVKLGLLPGPLRERGDASDRLAPQRASVIVNERIGYRDGWVRLVGDPSSRCVWLRELATLECPARHGEGRLVFADAALAAELAAAHQICLRYVDEQGRPTEAWPANPNGSPEGAAGLCDASGRVLGLMPHPEAFLYPENHPNWLVRRRNDEARSHGAGLQLFANGLRAALA